MLRNQEQSEEGQRRQLENKKLKSQVWRVKPWADDKRDPSSAAPINMVFTLPREFMAPTDEDEASKLEEPMAQLTLEPMPAIFEKLEDEKHRHL